MKKLWMSKLGIVLLCAAMMSACTDNAAPSSEAEASTVITDSASEEASGAQVASVNLTKKVEVDQDDSAVEWDSANSTVIKLNGASASIEGSGAEEKDGVIAITSAGTYVISGKLDDGQITVDVKDKGIVRLVLNGVNIQSSNSAPIYVIEAGKTIITLPDGTKNQISDGEDYVYPDASTDEPNAAIFSHDGLTFNGTGELVVQGNYNNGIVSKDELRIMGGAIEIHAKDDGLMGRDLVDVQEGNVTIEAGGHGIKTSNDEVDSLGIIAIEGGSFNIRSVEDAIHSSGGIQITGGDITIAADDEGIHADVSIAIAGGTIDITKSNEGIEASTIDISDGQISVIASDDGVNASGGADDSASEKAPGENQAGATSSNKLTISGGHLTVDSQGDGLDANGSIEMTGGTAIVNGPTANGNGSLDYDGTFVLTGGLLVAAGSSGMAQAVSDQSTQYGILMTYPETQQAGTIAHLEDSEGNNIITFAPTKNYQAIFISSPDMKKDATYTLYSGGTSTGSTANGLYTVGVYKNGTKVVEFKISTIVTWLNESGVTEARIGFGGGPGGGFGGRGEGGGRMRPDGEGGMPPEDQG